MCVCVHEFILSCLLFPPILRLLCEDNGVFENYCLHDNEKMRIVKRLSNVGLKLNILGLSARTWENVLNLYRSK